MQQFNAEEIGARIQQARNERGLTQPELAEMASFSTRSLQDYETGVTIPYRHLREIGDLLQKSVDWFLYGDVKPGDDTDEVIRRLDLLEGQVAEQLEILRQWRDSRDAGGEASPDTG